MFILAFQTLIIDIMRRVDIILMYEKGVLPNNIYPKTKMK